MCVGYGVAEGILSSEEDSFVLFGYVANKIEQQRKCYLEMRLKAKALFLTYSVSTTSIRAWQISNLNSKY